MKKLILLLLLLVSVSIYAQQAPNIGRFDGFVAPSGSPNGPANVAVCTSSGSGGPPCSPLTVIYSDQSGTGQQANPFQASITGRYTFFAPAGTYVVQTYGTGYTTTLATVTISGSSGGGGSLIGPGNAQAWAATDASQFGVKADAKFIFDASTTNGTGTITCPNSECGFTSTDVGKVCEVVGGSVFVPAGTITAVNNANSITCSTTSTGSASSNGVLIWGTDDDAALNTADAATFAQCVGLHIHGQILIKTGKFRTVASTSPGCRYDNLFGSSGGPQHAQVFGDGQTNTYLIPTTNFDFTTCTGNNHSCIGPGASAPTAEFRSFSISAGSASVGSNPATATIGFSNSFVTYDMTIGNWCGGCANFTASAMTAAAASAAWGGAQVAGTACSSSSAQTFMGPNWACIQAGNIGLNVSAGTSKTINTYFSGNTNSVKVAAGAQWMSDFDEVSGNASPFSISGTAYLNRFNATNYNTAAFFPAVIGSGGALYLANSNMNPASGNYATVASGGLLVDQCGNQTKGGVSVSGTGVYQPCPFSSASTAYTVQGNDSGTHANGALSANWTALFGDTLNYSSNTFINATGSGGSGGAAFWSAASFSNNQWSQLTLSSTGNATSGWGAIVRSGGGGSGNGYVLFATIGSPGPVNIYKLVAGTPTAIGTSVNITEAAGDTLRLEVQGTTLTGYYCVNSTTNCTAIVTATDATYASGSAGIEISKNATSAAAVNWLGGNIGGTAGTQTNMTITGLTSTGNTVFVPAGGFTTANNTSLQAITNLSWTLNPLLTTSPIGSFSFECHLQYAQATGTAAVAFGIQSATLAPTSINATGQEQTAATTFTGGNLQNLATTTATNIVSATPSAITTIWNADLYGTVEIPTGTPDTINIMVSTATGTDAVTIQRGSYCAKTP